MAKIVIKIELEDVNTIKLGNNILIQCKDNIDLIFTPSAIDEIINDYRNINSLEEQKSGI